MNLHKDFSAVSGNLAESWTALTLAKTKDELKETFIRTFFELKDNVLTVGAYRNNSASHVPHAKDVANLFHNVVDSVFAIEYIGGLQYKITSVATHSVMWEENDESGYPVFKLTMTVEPVFS